MRKISNQRFLDGVGYGKSAYQKQENQADNVTDFFDHGCIAFKKIVQQDGYDIKDSLWTNEK